MKKIIIIIILVIAGVYIYNSNSRSNTETVTESTQTEEESSMLSGDISYSVQKVFFNKPVEEVVGSSSDIQGTTSYEEGILNAQVNVATETFSSGSNARDREVPGFIGAQIMASIIDQNIALPYEGILPVNLTIADVTRETPFNLVVTENDLGLSISGEAEILMTNFNIDAPGNPNVYSVEDTVLISFNTTELTAVVNTKGEVPIEMSFFITSSNPGNGADFGGLAGADAHCQLLASNVGSEKNWAAYLSSSETEGVEVVNARERIGSGPWYNALGDIVADNVEDLHTDSKISKTLALDENGQQIPGRGDEKNQHDILTGSDENGMLSLGEDGEALTCNNWTSSDEGSAMVGHHDRLGPDTLATATSWNAAHGSRGCSLEDLQGTGGQGFLYCFATN